MSKQGGREGGIESLRFHYPIAIIEEKEKWGRRQSSSFFYSPIFRDDGVGRSVVMNPIGSRGRKRKMGLWLQHYLALSVQRKKRGGGEINK
eukprot:TRINITY_DN143_c0_g2_i4.p1 TRINITY_DN143_c0_g2~~TRINITY_DN143_c0_g2_i4.p1  ORF type:complete len:100 (-),score=2.52 TRINITY_DN143_c0_g2_i4:30-302(-)